MNAFINCACLSTFFSLKPAQPHNALLFLCGFVHLFKLDPRYPRLLQKHNRRRSARTAKCRAAEVTPTASHQSQKGIQGFDPIRPKRARGGWFLSDSEEGRWDCWGKEACWARMPLVARPYNLERCMQRTTRLPSRWKSRRSRDQT